MRLSDAAPKNDWDGHRLVRTTGPSLSGHRRKSDGAPDLRIPEGAEGAADRPRSGQSAASSFESGQPGHLYEPAPASLRAALEEFGITVPPSVDTMVKSLCGDLNGLLQAICAPISDGVSPWNRVVEIADELVSLTESHPYLTDVLPELCYEETGIARHSVQTAVLAAVLGREMERSLDVPVCQLAAAALVHDVGLNALGLKYSPLSGGSRYERHVRAGVKALESVGHVPLSVVEIVAQHHERIDGSGYPRGIRGAEVKLAAEVVGFADTLEQLFDLSVRNCLENRVGSMENYVQGALGRFRNGLSPIVGKAVVCLMGIYPNGVVVELSNRVVGRVVRQNRNHPSRPVVKVILDRSGHRPNLPRMFDLASQPALHIVRVLAR